MAAAAVALAAISAGAAPAQQPSQVEKGTFRLSVDGRAVGTESFAVRREGDVIRAAGRVQVEGDAGPFRALEVLLQTDTEYRPQLFRLQPRDGSPGVVAAARQGDRIRLQVSTRQGDRSREFVAEPGLTVLEPHVIHHYALLLRQLGDEVEDGGTHRAPVLLPSSGERGTLTLSAPAPVTLETPGGAVDARRWELDLPGARLRLWTDGEGRLLKAAEAGGAWTATRTDRGSG